MTSLIKAEIKRVTARRLTLVLFALAVAMPLLSAIMQLNSLRPISADDLATAQPEYQAALADWEANKEVNCGGDQTCVADTKPQLEWFLARSYISADNALNSAAENTSMYALLLATILASSLIGAEFTTGSISNQLSFTPNRLRVFFAKWLANLGSSVALSVVLVAVTVGATYGAIALAGAALPETTEPVLTLLRAGLYGVIGGILGTTLTFITRNTGATLGLLIGYLVASSFIQYGIFLLNKPGLLNYLPEYNMRPLLLGRTTDEMLNITATWMHSSIYWVVFLGTLTALALWVFRKRDVA